MRILGIESSCDETAAAIVESSGKVLAETVYSQISTHAEYGGVVPELASRDHLRTIITVVEQTFQQSGLDLNDIDLIGATSRPGLSGALLVGLQTAKALAWSHRKPLVGVDHLMGHLFAVFLQRNEAIEQPEFPFIGLLVSGGHTGLYCVNGPRVEDILELGSTRDDAVGEIYDKIAKRLGLSYPGGPQIDKLAQTASSMKFRELLPNFRKGRESLEFSFSGIKSAACRLIESREKSPFSMLELADFCASFQTLVVAHLVEKTLLAAQQSQIKTIVLGGGVAANSALRTNLRIACEQRGLKLHVPELANCTDNAAMIAYSAGLLYASNNCSDALNLAPATDSILAHVTRKGGGKR